MVTHTVFIGRVKLDIVVVSNSEQIGNYIPDGYAKLNFGFSIPASKKYIWFTNDDEMKRLGWEIENAVSFWVDKIIESRVELLWN